MISTDNTRIVRNLGWTADPGYNSEPPMTFWEGPSVAFQNGSIDLRYVEGDDHIEVYLETMKTAPIGEVFSAIARILPDMALTRSLAELGNPPTHAAAEGTIHTQKVMGGTITARADDAEIFVNLDVDSSSLTIAEVEFLAAEMLKACDDLRRKASESNG